MCENCKHHGPGFMSGALIGTVIGGILGVLYAPKPGKETREDLKVAADKVSTEGKKAVDEAKIIAEDVKVASQPLVAELERNVRPILHQAKGASKEVQIELMEKIEELVKEAAETSDKTSETMKKFLNK